KKLPVANKKPRIAERAMLVLYFYPLLKSKKAFQHC
ncbi:MAG: hypothetical protein ACI9OS_001933, partial [Ulvibacter sp.]